MSQPLTARGLVFVILGFLAAGLVIFAISSAMRESVDNEARMKKSDAEYGRIMNQAEAALHKEAVH